MTPWMQEDQAIRVAADLRGRADERSGHLRNGTSCGSGNYDALVRLSSHRIERRLRDRGLVLPGEVVQAIYEVALRSTDIARASQSTERAIEPRSKPAVMGTPMHVCVTDGKLFFVAPAPDGLICDVCAVAAADVVDRGDLDLLLVADPPRQYRFRLKGRAAGAPVAQQLINLREHRLAGLPGEGRALWRIQYADALLAAGRDHLAAEVYRGVADSGVWPYAGTAALNYGVLLRRIGAVEEAADYLERALATATEDVAGRSAMALGIDAIKRGDYGSARAYILRAKSLGQPHAAETIETLTALERGPKH